MSTPPLTQRIVLLEVNDEIPRAPLAAALPVPEGTPEWISTRKHLTEKIDWSTDPAVDWHRWSTVIQRVADRAMPSPNEAIDLHICAQAPLPLLVQFGHALKGWTLPATIHSRLGEKWYCLSTATGVERGFFPDQPDLDARGRSDRTDRWVALAISTQGGRISEDEIEKTLGENEAGAVIHLAGTGERLILSDANAAAFAGDIDHVFQAYRTRFPKARGLALFYAGPAPGAILIGRRFNPAVHRQVRVYNYRPQATTDRIRAPYELAVTLPWNPPLGRQTDWSAESVLARERTHRQIGIALEELVNKLRDEHMPSALLHREKVRPRLARLKLQDPPRRDTPGDQFDLDVDTATLRFSAPLLDALAPPDGWDHASAADELAVRRAAKLFILHELHHVDQKLNRGTYYGIGRASVVLEDIDYHADAFALATLIEHEIAWQDPSGEANRPQIATACVEAHLRTLEAFDRAEHGEYIERLAERRLRRYLVWHLQRLRMKTLHADAWSAGLALDARLLVELAPLSGRLDARYDKLVDGPTGDTALFISLRGNLARVERSNGYDPGALVDAIRRYDWEAIERPLAAALSMRRELLVAWLP